MGEAGAGAATAQTQWGLHKAALSRRKAPLSRLKVAPGRPKVTSSRPKAPLDYALERSRTQWGLPLGGLRRAGNSMGSAQGGPGGGGVFQGNRG